MIFPFGSTAPRMTHMRGVTLIELMVGLVIGLIATLVVAQVLNVAEGQKRNTTSGMDAQVNGALALYALQRDVSMAGYGLAPYQSVLGCDLRAQYGGAARSWTMAPVVIADGAGGAPDTITIMSSSNSAFALPTRVVENHTNVGTEFLTASAVGLSAGDAIIAVPPAIGAGNWCSLLQISSVTTDGAGHHVSHTNGTTTPWNPSTISSLLPAAGYPSGSYLIDAGQVSWRQLKIDTSRYVLQELVASTAGDGSFPVTATDLFTGIVNLQALYGKDKAATGSVDTYETTAPTTAAEWASVKTIRLALVARSGQYEKDKVTTSNLQWDVGMGTTVDGATSCGASQCLTLTLSNLPDWEHYRYKLYEVTVPLRNVLWSEK